MFPRLGRFLRELKRRNVYKVAATYAVVGFVLIQLADLTFVRLGLPSWTVTFLIVLVAMGFPLALVLAWAYERTPEGVRRTPDSTSDIEEAETEEGTSRSGQLAVKAFVGLGVVAAAVAGGWYLMGGGGSAPSELDVDERSVAVLPFDALSPDEESRTFARGLHDGLLTRLGHVAGLTVLSRQAVEKYRDAELTVGAIADSLGVRWVVEGGVVQVDDQIRVNAKLIDPRTEAQRWSDDYTRDFSTAEYFTLQEEITRRIVASLQTELTAREERQIARRPTDDLEAYQLYVRGRNLLYSRDGDSIGVAKAQFRRALERDSAYALAWSGLADALVLEPQYVDWETELGVVETVRTRLPEAERAARRALEIDPELAQGHASLGLIYDLKQIVGMKGKYGPRTLRELRRAVALMPSYAQAHQWLGSQMLSMGMPEGALEHLRIGVDLHPDSRIAQRDLNAALLANGRYDEALSRSRDWGPNRVTARILVHLERWGELRDYLEAYREEAGEEARSWADDFAALAALAAGDSTPARRRLEWYENADREGGPPLAVAHFLVTEGLFHAALGEHDEAIAAFREVQWTGNFSMTSSVRVFRYFYPDILGPVREDPRYQEIVREMNVMWGLNPDGSLPDSVDVSFEE